MPKTGRSAFSRAATIAGPPTAINPSMQAAKAPTPGTTSPSASAQTAASEVSTTSAPAAASARVTECRLPDP